MKKNIFLLVLSGLINSCGNTNVFQSMASKTSDEALLEDVNKLLNEKSWTLALSKLSGLSAETRSQYEVIKIEASIYAGKCGLDMLQFITSFGAGAIFKNFMSGFQAVVPFPADCQTAQTLIENQFGQTASDRINNLGVARGSDVNVFMAVLGTAKIGAQLGAKADLSPKDGTMDAGFTGCSSGSITDSEIAQVGTGFALLLANFTAISAQFDPSSAAAISSLNTLCATLSPNPCLITDPNNPSWANPATILAFRALVRSASVGIDPTSCIADNPINPLSYPFDCCP
jgi:hypothetical protein